MSMRLTIDAVRGPGCTIIAPQAVYDGLNAAQKAIATVLTNNASVDLLGVSVQAVPAYGANHPRGVGNGYVLEFGGKRIYVSGDTRDQPEIRALTDIDVAFVAMNQPYTMTVSAATNCVRAFRPRVVYPDHYRDQSGATTNAATFKQWLGTDLGIEVRLRNWY
jgi:L-ascorbate metabolism protein UlaG (beta-lactamase superfamily)